MYSGKGVSRCCFSRVGPRTLAVMPENPLPDLPDDWWTTADVLAFLKDVGAPISRATWAAYVSRGQAPAPARMFGRSPAWLPQDVRDWQAARPRRGAS